MQRRPAAPGSRSTGRAAGRFEHGGNDGSANNSHWHRGSRSRCGREALVGEFWHERVSADGYRGRGNSERLSFPARASDEMHIELMEPTNKADLTNAVARRLAQAGEGFYHLALRVDDVEGTGKTLVGKGLTLIERAPVAEGAKLRWVVHPKSSSGVLVELI